MREGALQAHNIRQQKKEKEAQEREDVLRKQREADEAESSRLQDGEESSVGKTNLLDEERHEGVMQVVEPQMNAATAAQTEQCEEQPITSTEDKAIKIEKTEGTTDSSGATQGDVALFEPVKEIDHDLDQEQEKHFGDDAYLYSNNFSNYEDGMEQSMFELEYMNQIGDD